MSGVNYHWVLRDEEDDFGNRTIIYRDADGHTYQETQYEDGGTCFQMSDEE